MITLKKSGATRAIISRECGGPKRSDSIAVRTRRRMHLDGSGGASGMMKERKLWRKLKNPGKKDAGGRADCGVFNLTFSSF